MGQALTTALKWDNLEETTTSEYIGRSISSDIYKYIVWKLNCAKSEDIISLIIRYIGFRMKSQILNTDEQVSLYKLLSCHHQSVHFKQSPLIFSNYVTYFELMYGQNIDGRHDIKRFKRNMLSSCIDKGNLLFVFHTEFDHKFAFFLPQPIQQMHGRYGEVVYHKIYDQNVPLFLLKVSKDMATDTVPRMIEMKVDKAEWPSFNDRYPMGIMNIGNVYLHYGHPAPYYMVYEIRFEEQIGGIINKFPYKRIEVFQLL